MHYNFKFDLIFSFVSVRKPTRIFSVYSIKYAKDTLGALVSSFLMYGITDF